MTNDTTAHRELTNPTGVRRIRINDAYALLLVPFPSKTTEANVCDQLHEVSEKCCVRTTGLQELRAVSV